MHKKYGELLWGDHFMHKEYGALLWGDHFMHKEYGALLWGGSMVSLVSYILHLIYYHL